MSFSMRLSSPLLQIVLSTAMALADPLQPYYFLANAQAQRCNRNGLSLYYLNIGLRGNLCAEIEAVPRIYACPALDTHCQTEGTDGLKFESPAPIDGYSICSTRNSTGGTVYWQCIDKYDTCNNVPGWSNNCQAVWLNPLRNASDDSSAVIAASIVAAQSTSSSASLSSQTASSTGIQTSAPAAQQFKPEKQSISGGAIAGISVGAVLIIALAVAMILFWRRSVRAAALNQNSHIDSQPSPTVFFKKQAELCHESPLPTEIQTQHSYQMIGTAVSELGNDNYSTEPMMKAKRPMDNVAELAGNETVSSHTPEGSASRAPRNLME